VVCQLSQYDDNMREHPVAYASMKLSATQSSWSVIEREAFAWALNRFRNIVTARCYGPVSVRQSVCVSVTSRSSTKTAKRRITQTTPHSPGTLVFWCQKSPQNSTGINPCGAPTGSGGVGQNRRLSTNSWLYLEKSTSMVSIKVV